jgi:transcriptional regulator of acetoin/glycerol metabolism
MLAKSCPPAIDERAADALAVNGLAIDGMARVRQARAALERSGIVPAGLLRPAITESWRRCVANGLDPRRAPAPDRLSEAELAAHRERHALVRQFALSEMPALHRELGANRFILAFAAPDGVLLDSLVAAPLRREVEAFGIAPGAVWCEAKLGTNALGTAIATGGRIDVRGPEHFFADHHRLSCITVPIFDPEKRLAAVLDASCDAAAYLPQARAVLALAAAQIEASLFRARHAGRRLALHGRPEFLDTAQAGLLALDDADRIIAANAPARFMLAGLPEPVGAPLAALFAPDGLAAAAGLLSDRSGRVFHCRREDGTARTRPTAPSRLTEASPPAVCEDAALRVALDLAGRAAQRGLPVLIRGETGTGKEVAARMAHRLSGRSGKFVAVNCAAIPPDLLAAELFGHAEGAFTGARRGGARGLAVEADGGTLFLDEIADLPAGVQAALLRFLDDFSVRPVGGTTTRVVDTLLLAATNADLAAAVAAGKFRADLYYRLAITEIHLPRLAERTDFGSIAIRLLAEIAPECRLDEAAIARLQRQDWPGNIRQLRNALSRLSLHGAALIDADAVGVVLPEAAAAPAQSVLRDVQTRQVAAAMRETDGNISEAARRLGVSRNTIYRAMRNL